MNASATGPNRTPRRAQMRAQGGPARPGFGRRAGGGRGLAASDPPPNESVSHSLLSLYEQQQQTRSPSLPHLRIRRGQDHEQRRHHRKAHVLDRDAAPLVDKRDGEPVSGDGPDDRDERVSHGGAVDCRIHTQRARALAGDGGGGARVALGQLDRVREARALEDVREEEILRVEGDVEEEPFLFLFLLLLFRERARERK